jgi:hypothetical protein
MILQMHIIYSRLAITCKHPDSCCLAPRDSSDWHSTLISDLLHVRNRPSRLKKPRTLLRCSDHHLSDDTYFTPHVESTLWMCQKAVSMCTLFYTDSIMKSRRQVERLVVWSFSYHLWGSQPRPSRFVYDKDYPIL